MASMVGSTSTRMSTSRSAWACWSTSRSVGPNSGSCSPRSSSRCAGRPRRSSSARASSSATRASSVESYQPPRAWWISSSWRARSRFRSARRWLRCELGGGLLPGRVVGLQRGEPGAGEGGVLGVLPAQLIGGAHLLGDVGRRPRLLAGPPLPHRVEVQVGHGAVVDRAGVDVVAERGRRPGSTSAGGTPAPGSARRRSRSPRRAMPRSSR